MDDDNKRADPNNPAPVDPSDTTRHVGDKVEQGVVKIKEGITEQSTKWEDEQERTKGSQEEASS